MLRTTIERMNPSEAEFYASWPGTKLGLLISMVFQRIERPGGGTPRR
jgi:hypothetical protein